MGSVPAWTHRVAVNATGIRDYDTRNPNRRIYRVEGRFGIYGGFSDRSGDLPPVDSLPNPGGHSATRTWIFARYRLRPSAVDCDPRISSASWNGYCQILYLFRSPLVWLHLFYAVPRGA